MTKITRTLASCDPAKLVKHPTSLKIYGEKADDGFDASVKARGVDEPIVVAADGKTIVSGVRRRNAAIKAKMKLVPVITRIDLVDGLDIEEAIIEANRHNEQSMEAKARAFSRLKEIESERADKRMKSQLKQGNAPASTTSGTAGKSGRAVDVAAGQVGLGKTTAVRASEVVKKIDEAEAAGDTETATDLRENIGAFRSGGTSEGFSTKKEAIKRQRERVGSNRCRPDHQGSFQRSYRPPAEHRPSGKAERWQGCVPYDCRGCARGLSQGVEGNAKG